MVNLQGKESTALKTIQQSLITNLNIIPSDSRLKTITDKIADSKYRIKDLSTITNTIRCRKITIIDGKIFLLPEDVNAGTIEVRDYQTNALLKTINDGANVMTAAICFDDDYIYIGKTVETTTDKKYRDVYIRKYNRCTLDLVSESPILFAGSVPTSSSNSVNTYGMIENGEYLYLACYGEKILKIKKVDFSSVANIAWRVPLHVIKRENGFFVMGNNAASSSDSKYRRIDFVDWELNILQTFPQTTLSVAVFRNGFYKDDFLYAVNDSGVLVKYQISTNTIVAETKMSGATIIYSMLLINNDFLLLQTSTSKIMLYDLNLNFIKMWDFYNAGGTVGYMLSDKNNTIWTQSASRPTTIYKKQFIDMTKNIT